ncbi:variable large family protein, partial [Borreliella burgdorferi]|uniref:variable large family protein n=1 Tax=Borreliella burgdorferi TaxID=139 RepID=UPI0039BFF46B
AVAAVAKAVGAVDGKQILKAIVEAAGKGDAGKKANAANNPIEAAIGGANDNAANGFGEAMKKSDQIAAAIVLRGLAKDGKFAADANEGALKGVNEAGGDNKDAGKIFATGAGGNANAEAVAVVAKAVGAVDGKQILKAIVDSADKGGDGKKANEANNPIDAAIGGAGDNGTAFGEAMQKSDQIAAAIVLRGLAKDGKFAAAAAGGNAGGEKIGNVDAGGAHGKKADADNVKEIAGGIKGIVEAAGKDALKGVNGAGDNNENAGKIFATGGGGANADAAAVADVAKAVGAVDGKQILKAIVEAAGKGDNGTAAANATNPIEAAIGDANDDGANGFGQAAMKKSDQIAAAIVLRGLAKDGKFAAADNEGAKVKNAVESAVKLLESMITATTAAATAGGNAGDEKIGNVDTAAAGAAGAKADADNVKEIAGGIKGIVEAAGEDALKGVDGAGDNNENAGKIFATGGNGADAAAVAAVAKAVGAVDGKQILKAIVEAAGKGDAGKTANEANNPIDAAIGGAGDNGAGATAGGKAGSDEKIGNVATGAAGAKADAANVKEIAGGIKGIVEAAGEDALKGVNEAGGDNKNAGKIFATGGNGADAAAVAVVAKAVGAVDGKQILKAIVEAAGKGDNGKTAANANNPIEAAIGGDNDNAANGFVQAAMKKSDQIAAAIVLRGLAKDGKFAAAANEGATAGGNAGGEKIGNVADAGGGGAKADADNVKEIAGGIKGIVEAAGKDALKGVNEAGGDNENAGKIFATGGGGANADAEAVADVAKAVGAVDGKQILKAIVEAAGKGGNGAAANAANNPIEAAIGGANDDGAGATAGGKAGSEKIGNVAAAGAGKQAAADNVKEIASGIKGIVAAAGEDALKGVNEAGDNNENAGKIFATGGNGADAAAVADVAKAVGAVDGKQILKAIVDSAGKGDAGKKANEANNPIEAAIGDANDAGAGATAGGKAGSDKIGNVADAGAAGKQADAANVKEIAGGIKGIVEAAGEDALKGVNGANDDNKNAGKIFATGAGANANAAAVADVAKAVGAVDGKQILKAIVEAAGKGDDGKTAANANNPIEAAIGGDNDNAAAFGEAMKKSDQIAAAIVLRGLAKDGKFAAANANEGATAGGKAGSEKIGNVDAAAAHGKKADADNVKKIADGIKGIVEAAGEDALKGVDEAGGDNKDAGKIFATGGAGADAEAVAAVAKAVGAVDGKQILKAIVEAADKGDAGKTANEANNPIDAAIGGDNDNAANGFGQAMQKSDQIAAAIVLRGLAKDGKFAAADNEGAGEEKIGNVDAAAAHGKKADADNVKEIAGGIKGIVEAAGKDALKGVNEAGGDNKNAGKIFATAGGGGANANAEAVAAVAKAVGAVDGKQILKAIVEAAGKGDAGAAANAANNPIDAAIGGAGDNGAAFGAAMQKSDQIAAAIVLRGLAKDGKFAAAANEGALKDVNEAGDDNENAGKIFATGGGGANADAAAVAVVAKAVGAVDGKQILKAIVDSAGKGDDGAAAANATNPIDAAIGGANDNAANGFGEAAMKKSDQIAAAIVLRGLAKDGKFAAAANEGAGEEKIGNVATGATGATGKQANADNVKEIAGGIKGIVEAAGKDALKGVNEAGGDNENAGKIFATAAGAGANANAAAVAVVAKAVGAVDGKQILKAIVDSADKGGAKANEATNPIEAAIGGADDDGTAFGEAMKKSDQIAAAIVLRGLAKDGKFAAAGGDKAGDEKIGNVAAVAAHGKKADAANVKEIAGGIKGIVEAAGKDALKDVNRANDNNADAGKIFATTGGGADAEAAAVADVAKAVGAVDGKQILKAIVEAADKGDNGKKADDATNPIEAAIGGANDNAANGFRQGAMKKSDQIAAAIVLRGLAKDGKFAAANNEGAKVKNAVESAVKLLESMITATTAAATAGGNAGGEKIGNVDTGAAGAGKQAAAANVKEIAGGIKGIVEAAGKDALKGVNEANDNNADAGKIFATTGGGGANANA